MAFAGTYLGMAIGRIPGLRIDRAGIAMVAVALLLVTGTVDVAGIGRAVDGETLVLLFALMVVSAQFGLSGFYDRCVSVRSESSYREPQVQFCGRQPGLAGRA